VLTRGKLAALRYAAPLGLACALALVAPGAAQGAPVNSLSLQSDKDTYFLYGARQASYSAEQARFTSSGNPNLTDSNGRPRKKVAGAAQSNTDSRYYALTFTLPADTPMQLGRSYPIRDASAGDAFLEVTNGAICDSKSGSFVFSQYREQADGTPLVMDVSFTSTCDIAGPQTITLTGRFRLNADDEPVPAPTTTPDRVRPGLTGLGLSRSAFKRGGKGARVGWRLSEAARTRFTIERRSRGRRYRRVKGSIPVAGRAGLNRFRFRGSVGGRRLRPGRYRLVARARDAAGNLSAPRRAAFRITR